MDRKIKHNKALQSAYDLPLIKPTHFSNKLNLPEITTTHNTYMTVPICQGTNSLSP